jgi:hypothetical protein
VKALLEIQFSVVPCHALGAIEQMREHGRNVGNGKPPNGVFSQEFIAQVEMQA